MATLINVGPRYVLDETANLQTTGEDDDVARGTLPAVFANFLFGNQAGQLALSDQFAVQVGAAHSSGNIVSITSPGPVAALTLHDTNNGALNGDDSNILTLDNNHVFLYATADPHIVIGREGTGTTANASGQVVFALYLDAAADNKSATMWSVLFEPIQHPTGNPDEVVDLGQSLKIGVTGDFNVNLGTLEAGQLFFGSFGDPDNGNPADQEIAVIVIAKDQSTGDGDGKDTINTSKAAGAVTIGVSNQMFDAGEGAYYTFVNGMTGTNTSKGVILPAAGANDPNAASKIVYGDLVSSGGSSFTIVQIQAGGNSPKTSVKVSVFVTAEEQGAAFVTGLTNDTQLDIKPTSVQVLLGATDITNTVTITEDGLSVRVANVPEGATVRYLSFDPVTGNPVDHNRVLIENVNGNPFDIGGFALLAEPTFAYIGQAIGFGDDGPTAAISLSGTGAVTDESTGADATDTGLAAPNDEAGKTAALVAGKTLIGYDQETLVSTAASSFGTDGAGTKVVSLELGSGSSIDSGLNTTSGADIILYKVGSVIVGRTAGVGTEVFAIGIDADGKVTVEQYGSIDHLANSGVDQVIYLDPNTVLAKVAMTDKDTDSDAKTVDISGKIGFEDDAPKVTLALNGSPTLVVDESVGSDANDANAADEAASADVTDIGYATIAGATLFNNTVDMGEDGEGATTGFSLRLGTTAAGVTTLATSLKASNGDKAITLVKVNDQTVEGRFDTSTVAFRIGIDATSGAVTLSQFVALEHPTFPSSYDESLALGSNLVFAVVSAKDGDDDSAGGAVDIGTIMSFQDDGPLLTTGGDIVVANTLNATGDKTFVSDVGSDAPGAYKIVSAPTTGGFTWAYADVDGNAGTGVNEIKGKLDGSDFYSLFVDANGKYTFKLLDTLDPNTLTLGATVIKAGAPDTQFIEVSVLDGGVPVAGQLVRISGFVGTTPDAINESHRNVGVDNGNLDGNESMQIQLIDDTTPNVPGDGTLVPISSITVGTKTAQAVDYTFKLTLAGQTVYDGTAHAEKGGPVTMQSPTLAKFDTAILTQVNGTAVKIGLDGIFISTPPDDLVLNFLVELMDQDKDTNDAGFKVGIDADGVSGVDLSAVGLSLVTGMHDLDLAMQTNIA